MKWSKNPKRITQYIHRAKLAKLHFHKGPSAFRAWYREPEHITAIVVELAGKRIIGIACMNSGHEGGVYVKRPHRRRGIGLRLAQKLRVLTKNRVNFNGHSLGTDKFYDAVEKPWR